MARFLSNGISRNNSTSPRRGPKASGGMRQSDCENQRLSVPEAAQVDGAPSGRDDEIRCEDVPFCLRAEQQCDNHAY